MQLVDGVQGGRQEAPALALLCLLWGPLDDASRHNPFGNARRLTREKPYDFLFLEYFMYEDV